MIRYVNFEGRIFLVWDDEFVHLLQDFAASKKQAENLQWQLEHERQARADVNLTVLAASDEELERALALRRARQARLDYI